MQALGDFANTLGDFGLGDLPQLQRVGDVVEAAPMRVQGQVFENHRHVSILGMHLIDGLVAQPNLTLVRFLQAGDDAQRSGLSGTRRSQQAEKAAVRLIEAQPFQGFDIRKAFTQVGDAYGSHQRIACSL